MDLNTLEALKASIAKWERNAAAETSADVAMGMIECPLCKRFYLVASSCVGCPVMMHTGESGCGGTPYDPAFDASEDWDDDPSDLGAKERFHIAAREEVAFLKSLLPVESE